MNYSNRATACFVRAVAYIFYVMITAKFFVVLTDSMDKGTAQLSLFPDVRKERSRILDKAYDTINKKFCAATIQRGSNLQSNLRVGKKYQAQLEQKKNTK